MKKLIMFGLIAFISLSSVKSFASIESKTVAVETVSLSTTALLHPDDTVCDKIWDLSYRYWKDKKGKSIEEAKELADGAKENCILTTPVDDDKPEEPKKIKKELDDSY